ncbi:hypothetical protein ANAPC1_00546 [Anaplasma phagocytophilum]|uniref:Uncharacterized protein n=1 Tax=Anaplasma phagocytophilum TaxID=948 RepID=A0AA45ZHD5_ANAPH|nr:hypothetical protein ANAPC1_00546 [Anaplasma phagocytophilum]SCV66652.1 hypothetical protein ANAPRD1_01189 [Anaplasma phagocytophilum]
MEISHSSIGEKVCKTKEGTSGAATKFGEYAEKTATTVGSDHTTAVCGGKNYATSGGSKTKPEVLRDFVRATLRGDGSVNWPTSTGGAKATGEPVTNDNAKAVAKDLVKELTSDEKTIVAGLLAKTIEGGEVVEMCLSPST